MKLHSMLADPNTADTLLAKTMHHLSLKERNGVQEEIHGVRCLAPEETPELLKESLENLALALDNDDLLPQHIKESYLKSQTFSSTYVNDDSFRLRFLRFNAFDINKAALKMVRFLEMLEFFFGLTALRRPIRLSDLCNQEMQFMRKGACQFMPFRDRSGRRILAIMNPHVLNQKIERKDFENLTKREKSEKEFFCTGKVLMYMTWTAGYEIETQRRGLVYLVWYDSTFDPKICTERFYSVPWERRLQFSSVRPCAIHLCTPDTHQHRFIRALLLLRINKVNRSRIKIHLGDSIELRYSLQTYGIPSQDIPVSFSGTLKSVGIKQWMRLRLALETPVDKNEAGCVSMIVECPSLSDVLFRQGKSMFNHPGNVMVRNLIQSKHKEQILAEQKEKVKIKRRKIISEITEEIRHTSRFLVWSENGWWTQLTDQEQLICKIEYMIKDYRKTLRVNQVNVNSSTVLFRSHHPDSLGSTCFRNSNPAA